MEQAWCRPKASPTSAYTLTPPYNPLHPLTIPCTPYLALQAEGIAVRRAVLNRLINDEQVEQADGGYLTRLSKGQLECRTELADLATRCDVTVTEVHLSHLYT